MKLLLNSIADLRRVVPINADLDFSNIAPSLHAAQLFVARFTGEKLIANLAELVHSGLFLSTAQARLLAALLVPIGNLAAAKYARIKSVTLTDVGTMRTTAGQQADAFEWQLEASADQLTQEAWAGLENLLRMLELHRTDYPVLADSEEFLDGQDSLITSADLFNRYYFIASSRLTFWSLSACLRAAEETTIKPLLGATYETLLGEIDLTASQKTLLGHMRRALVYATLANAVEERLVDISETGLTVNAISQFGKSTPNRAPASEARLERALANFQRRVGEALALAIPLLPTPPDYSPGRGVQGSGIVSF